MAIITLTTDFGEKDHFAGAIKGAIYSECQMLKLLISRILFHHLIFLKLHILFKMHIVVFQKAPFIL